MPVSGRSEVANGVACFGLLDIFNTIRPTSINHLNNQSVGGCVESRQPADPLRLCAAVWHLVILSPTLDDVGSDFVFVGGF